MNLIRTNVALLLAFTVPLLFADAIDVDLVGAWEGKVVKSSSKGGPEVWSQGVKLKITRSSSGLEGHISDDQNPGGWNAGLEAGEGTVKAAYMNDQREFKVIESKDGPALEATFTRWWQGKKGYYVLRLVKISGNDD